MRPLALAAAVLALTLTGCSAPSSNDRPGDAASGSPSTTVTSPAPSDSQDPSEQSIVGTVVRFTAGDASVDVTVDEDTPATRDFLSLLPMNLELEDFDASERIAYLPRELDWDGTPGSDPEDGDLIYYAPWGNIGFFYDATGMGRSDQVLHLGTYDATEAELAELEGRQTTVRSRTDARTALHTGAGAPS